MLALTYALQRRIWSGMADELIACRMRRSRVRVDADLRLPLDQAPCDGAVRPIGLGEDHAAAPAGRAGAARFGQIRFGGETWFDSGRGILLPPQQRRAGFLFQDYALFPT